MTLNRAGLALSYLAFAAGLLLLMATVTEYARLAAPAPVLIVAEEPAP